MGGSKMYNQLTPEIIDQIRAVSGHVFLLQPLKNGPKHPQDGLRWKSVQHESCASRRGGWFGYKNRPNPWSYEDTRAKTVSCCQKTGLGRIIRALSRTSGPGGVNSPCFIRFWWFGRLGKSFSCTGSPPASYIDKRWRPIEQQHTIAKLIYFLP